MKLVYKILLGAIVFTITGAILIDLHIIVTGYTMLFLGIGGLILGPLVPFLDDL